jgi:hypothetical protein
MIEQLGFTLYCENIWFKYIEINCVKTPHFLLTRFANPSQNKFIVRNLLVENDELITDNYLVLQNYITSSERDKKIDELIN